VAVIGTLIDGKYEILKLIGKGGMSEVYLAMDQNLNKQWAIKEIRKKAWDKNNQVVVQSAIAEANMMKRLDHPCLPRIVDIIDKDDVIYVVMDYIEGEPLSKVLEKEGAQEQELVIQWAEELCGVLDYLHGQDPPIIYRDMKPANIMLQPNGNIKLIDFGIAREYKEHNLEDTVSLGTKGYAAPEQFGGKGQTDQRTDVYCLGVTLYHLVTGKNPCEPPYELYPIRYWNAELSAGLENIILKCTQLNPEDRYQSCAELMYAILHYEEEDDAYKKKQWKKMRLFAGTLAATVVSLAVGFTGQLLKVHAQNNDYENNLLRAEIAADNDEKIAYYQDAIAIKPAKTDAYLGMIEAFKDDAVFTVEEEAELKKDINVNLSQLQQSDGYADLAYEIGKLYWYYYDYGSSADTDNQITRMKSAIQWFDDAYTYGNEEDSYYLITQVYSEIGQFNRDVTLKVEEAEDKGTYAPYFEDLQMMYEKVAEEENEIVNLETYKLCMYSIENYARKFMLDDISQEDLEELYQKVETSVKQITTTTDKTAEMKTDILERSSAAKQAIINAYET
jgi:serine/threonine-protein kinase